MEEQSKALAPSSLNSVAKAAEAAMMELVLVDGDLSKMPAQQRVSFYIKTCDSLGLNPVTKPFEYIRLNSKLVLYASKNCTDQIRFLHKVSVSITSREKIGDVYVVTARASTPDGRQDESTGAVTLGKLSGDNLANAMMKAETKAKRRVTLSICGLSFSDESEVESIPNAEKVPKEVAESSDPLPVAALAAPPVITVEQWKRFQAIAKLNGYTGDEIGDWMQYAFKVTKGSELTRAQYDAVWAHFSVKKPEPVQSPEEQAAIDMETQFAELPRESI